nr:uncharacterized protein LOC112708898 [Arachis hypogaea]
MEKNVCDNIVFTMLNESGKSKDHLKARKDLQLMGIRNNMWPLESGKYPSAVFTIKNVIFPDGSSATSSPPGSCGPYSVPHGDDISTFLLHSHGSSNGAFGQGDFWLIDSDGTIKPARLSVREAIERPNGRRIILRFNNAKQAIGNEAVLLSRVLGLLGFDFGKFLLCEESWHKIITKDKQIFHFDEDSEGTIKKNILKSLGKSWKETRLRLYNTFYEPTFTTEQNIEHRPPGIGREHWRWFLDYHAKAKAQNNKGEESVEESYGSQYTKKKDGSYINDEARAIGERIEEIEQQDESSRVLSQNDFIAQVFGKEKPGRVRGVGFGPTPSQLFSPNSHAPGNGVQLEETQRKLLELQAELEGEKLKRKAMEDEATTEKKKMKAMESALIYLFQR